MDVKQVLANIHLCACLGCLGFPKTISFPYQPLLETKREDTLIPETLALFKKTPVPVGNVQDLAGISPANTAAGYSSVEGLLNITSEQIKVTQRI